MMSSLPITARHGKALSTAGHRPTDAPAWIDEVDNPYLHGLFAPIQTLLQADDLTVLEGGLPRDLWGGYLRRTQGRYALARVCVGGGQGTAIVLERA